MISHQDQTSLNIFYLLHLSGYLCLDIHSLCHSLSQSYSVLCLVLISSKFLPSVCFGVSASYVGIFYQMLSDPFLFLVHFFSLNFSF